MVQRYCISISNTDNDLEAIMKTTYNHEPDDDGLFVLYADYEMLEKRCESLDRIVHQGTLLEMELRLENDVLKKQLEKVTQEMKAMNNAKRGLPTRELREGRQPAFQGSEEGD